MGTTGGGAEGLLLWIVHVGEWRGGGEYGGGEHRTLRLDSGLTGTIHVTGNGLLGT